VDHAHLAVATALEMQRRIEAYREEWAFHGMPDLSGGIGISTGEAVMARGGFHGLDPALSPEKLARMVEEKQIRFVMLGDVAVVSRMMGAGAAGKPIVDWVRANGKLVDRTLWRSIHSRGRVGLYDLRPEVALVPVSPG
jgi:4-amino-4-deoxy-L-arabinose transferase-like glycosyltransferase